MFVVAMLLISSMTLREYAHFEEHTHYLEGQFGTTPSNFDHEAKFHYVTEAQLAFEPPLWHRQVVCTVQSLSENNAISEPHLLPETRAPPACV